MQDGNDIIRYAASRTVGGLCANTAMISELFALLKSK